MGCVTPAPSGVVSFAGPNDFELVKGFPYSGGFSPEDVEKMDSHMVIEDDKDIEFSCVHGLERCAINDVRNNDLERDENSNSKHADRDFIIDEVTQDNDIGTRCLFTS